jgi:hypothetical protein
VIAQAYLNEWASKAPWSQQIQIEQDLILSRLIVEIAQHELLGPELAFRGGTCLHKLHLSAPLRYSEDLDYVRGAHSGIKPYLTALREVAPQVSSDDARSRRLWGALRIDAGRWMQLITRRAWRGKAWLQLTSIGCGMSRRRVAPTRVRRASFRCLLAEMHAKRAKKPEFAG